MRIVVTGASGNVGTALLRQLGSHDVVGISRRRPPDTNPYRGTEWVQQDIGSSGSHAALTAAFHGADAVVHLAWLIQPGRRPDVMRRTNQGGTRAVIAAVRAAGVPHLVHMSSVGTYSPAPGTWHDESWDTDGVATSSYSNDKAACERMLDAVTDVVLTRVRPALILQPDAASEISRYFLGRLVPPAVLHPALLRFVPAPARTAIQFVHADDVAAALVTIIEQQVGGAFNLAADPVVDRSVLRAHFGGNGPALPVGVVRALADWSWQARLQPTDAGWIDLGFSVPLMKTDRARDLLGWQPRHRADDTLADFVQALHRRAGAPGPLLHPRAVKE